MNQQGPCYAKGWGEYDKRENVSNEEVFKKWGTKRTLIHTIRNRKLKFYNEERVLGE